MADSLEYHKESSDLTDLSGDEEFDDELEGVPNLSAHGPGVAGPHGLAMNVAGNMTGTTNREERNQTPDFDPDVEESQSSSSGTSSSSEEETPHHPEIQGFPCVSEKESPLLSPQEPTNPQEVDSSPLIPKMGPKPTTFSTVPEPTTSSTVPAPTTSSSVPEPTISSTIPEPTTSSTIPEAADFRTFAGTMPSAASSSLTEGRALASSPEVPASPLERPLPYGRASGFDRSRIHSRSDPSTIGESPVWIDPLSSRKMSDSWITATSESAPNSVLNTAVNSPEKMEEGFEDVVIPTTAAQHSGRRTPMKGGSKSSRHKSPAVQLSRSHLPTEGTDFSATLEANEAPNGSPLPYERTMSSQMLIGGIDSSSSPSSGGHQGMSSFAKLTDVCLSELRTPQPSIPRASRPQPSTLPEVFQVPEVSTPRESRVHASAPLQGAMPEPALPTASPLLQHLTTRAPDIAASMLSKVSKVVSMPVGVPEGSMCMGIPEGSMSRGMPRKNSDDEAADSHEEDSVSFCDEETFLPYSRGDVFPPTDMVYPPRDPVFSPRDTIYPPAEGITLQQELSSLAASEGVSCQGVSVEGVPSQAVSPQGISSLPLMSPSESQVIGVLESVTRQAIIELSEPAQANNDSLEKPRSPAKGVEYQRQGTQATAPSGSNPNSVSDSNPNSTSSKSVSTAGSLPNSAGKSGQLSIDNRPEGHFVSQKNKLAPFVISARTAPSEVPVVDLGEHLTEIEEIVVSQGVSQGLVDMTQEDSTRKPELLNSAIQHPTKQNPNNNPSSDDEPSILVEMLQEGGQWARVSTNSRGETTKSEDDKGPNLKDDKGRSAVDEGRSSIDERRQHSENRRHPGKRFDEALPPLTLPIPLEPGAVQSTKASIPRKEAEPIESLAIPGLRLSIEDFGIAYATDQTFESTENANTFNGFSDKDLQVSNYYVDPRKKKLDPNMLDEFDPFMPPGLNPTGMNGPVETNRLNPSDDRILNANVVEDLINTTLIDLLDEFQSDLPNGNGIAANVSEEVTKNAPTEIIGEAVEEVINVPTAEELLIDVKEDNAIEILPQEGDVLPKEGVGLPEEPFEEAFEKLMKNMTETIGLSWKKICRCRVLVMKARGSGIPFDSDVLQTHYKNFNLKMPIEVFAERYETNWIDVYKRTQSAHSHSLYMKWDPARVLVNIPTSKDMLRSAKSTVMSGMKFGRYTQFDPTRDGATILPTRGNASLPQVRGKLGSDGKMRIVAATNVNNLAGVDGEIDAFMFTHVDPASLTHTKGMLKSSVMNQMGLMTERQPLPLLTKANQNHEYATMDMQIVLPARTEKLGFFGANSMSAPSIEDLKRLRFRRKIDFIDRYGGSGEYRNHGSGTSGLFTSEKIVLEAKKSVRKFLSSYGVWRKKAEIEKEKAKQRQLDEDSTPSYNYERIHQHTTGDGEEWKGGCIGKGNEGKGGRSSVGVNFFGDGAGKKGIYGKGFFGEDKLFYGNEGAVHGKTLDGKTFCKGHHSKGEWVDGKGKGKKGKDGKKGKKKGDCIARRYGGEKSDDGNDDDCSDGGNTNGNNIQQHLNSKNYQTGQYLETGEFIKYKTEDLLHPKDWDWRFTYAGDYYSDFTGWKWPESAFLHDKDTDLYWAPDGAWYTLEDMKTWEPNEFTHPEIAKAFWEKTHYYYYNYVNSKTLREIEQEEREKKRKEEIAAVKKNEMAGPTIYNAGSLNNPDHDDSLVDYSNGPFYQDPTGINGPTRDLVYFNENEEEIMYQGNGSEIYYLWHYMVDHEGWNLDSVLSNNLTKFLETYMSEEIELRDEDGQRRIYSLVKPLTNSDNNGSERWQRTVEDVEEWLEQAAKLRNPPMNNTWANYFQTQVENNYYTDTTLHIKDGYNADSTTIMKPNADWMSAKPSPVATTASSTPLDAIDEKNHQMHDVLTTVQGTLTIVEESDDSCSSSEEIQPELVVEPLKKDTPLPPVLLPSREDNSTTTNRLRKTLLPTTGSIMTLPDYEKQNLMLQEHFSEERYPFYEEIILVEDAHGNMYVDEESMEDACVDNNLFKKFDSDCVHTNVRDAILWCTKWRGRNGTNIIVIEQFVKKHLRVRFIKLNIRLFIWKYLRNKLQVVTEDDVSIVYTRWWRPRKRYYYQHDIDDIKSTLEDVDEHEQDSNRDEENEQDHWNRDEENEQDHWNRDEENEQDWWNRDEGENEQHLNQQYWTDKEGHSDWNDTQYHSDEEQQYYWNHDRNDQGKSESKDKEHRLQPLVDYQREKGPLVADHTKREKDDNNTNKVRFKNRRQQFQEKRNYGKVVYCRNFETIILNRHDVIEQWAFLRWQWAEAHYIEAGGKWGPFKNEYGSWGGYQDVLEKHGLDSDKINSEDAIIEEASDKDGVIAVHSKDGVQSIADGTLNGFYDVFGMNVPTIESGSNYSTDESNTLEPIQHGSEYSSENLVTMSAYLPPPLSWEDHMNFIKGEWDGEFYGKEETNHDDYESNLLFSELQNSCQQSGRVAKVIDADGNVVALRGREILTEQHEGDSSHSDGPDTNKLHPDAKINDPGVSVPINFLTNPGRKPLKYSENLEEPSPTLLIPKSYHFDESKDTNSPRSAPLGHLAPPCNSCKQPSLHTKPSSGSEGESGSQRIQGFSSISRNGSSSSKMAVNHPHIPLAKSLIRNALRKRGEGLFVHEYRQILRQSKISLSNFGCSSTSRFLREYMLNDLEVVVEESGGTFYSRVFSLPPGDAKSDPKYNQSETSLAAPQEKTRPKFSPERLEKLKELISDQLEYNQKTQKQSPIGQCACEVGLIMRLIHETMPKVLERIPTEEHLRTVVWLYLGTHFVVIRHEGILWCYRREEDEEPTAQQESLPLQRNQNQNEANVAQESDVGAAQDPYGKNSNLTSNEKDVATDPKAISSHVSSTNSCIKSSELAEEKCCIDPFRASFFKCPEKVTSLKDAKTTDGMTALLTKDVAISGSRYESSSLLTKDVDTKASGVSSLFIKTAEAEARNVKPTIGAFGTTLTTQGSPLSGGPVGVGNGLVLTKPTDAKPLTKDAITKDPRFQISNTFATPTIVKDASKKEKKEKKKKEKKEKKEKSKDTTDGVTVKREKKEKKEKTEKVAKRNEKPA